MDNATTKTYFEELEALGIKRKIGNRFDTPEGNTLQIRTEAQANAQKNWAKHKEEQAAKGFIIGNDNRLFTYAFMEELKQLSKQIGIQNMGLLLLLQTNIQFDTGALVRAVKTKDPEPMKKADIISFLDLSESGYKRFVKVMKSNGVIVQKKVDLKGDGKQMKTAFVVNKQFHFRGSTDSHEAIKVFSATLKEAAKSLSTKDIGFLAMLLPYCHYTTNVICSNPYEKNPGLVQKMNAKDIAEELEIHENTVVSHMKRLRTKKEKVIAETRTGAERNERFFILNPWVFYRQPGYPKDQLLLQTFAKSTLAPN